MSSPIKQIAVWENKANLLRLWYEFAEDKRQEENEITQKDQNSCYKKAQSYYRITEKIIPQLSHLKEKHQPNQLNHQPPTLPFQAVSPYWPLQITHRLRQSKPTEVYLISSCNKANRIHFAQLSILCVGNQVPISHSWLEQNRYRHWGNT